MITFDRSGPGISVRLTDLARVVTAMLYLLSHKNNFTSAIFVEEGRRLLSYFRVIPNGASPGLRLWPPPTFEWALRYRSRSSGMRTLVVVWFREKHF